MVKCLAEQGGRGVYCRSSAVPRIRQYCSGGGLRSLPEAVPEVDVVIAPMSHTDAAGTVQDSARGRGNHSVG